MICSSCGRDNDADARFCDACGARLDAQLGTAETRRVVTIVFTVGFLFPLKILVAFLQAFIFVMLTMLYISGAIEEADHHSEHH